MESLKKLYRKYMPVALRNYCGEIRTERIKKRCFEEVKSGKWMSDYRAESEYMIKKGKLITFPYLWTEEYNAKDIDVLYDIDKAMPYVKVQNRKLYFPAKYPKKYIQKYFNSILIDQDCRSTHFYFDLDKVDFKESTFFDIGGAEGFISLIVAPYVKQILIFECDPDWIKALEMTFEPWKEKTQIINKFVSSKTSEDEICLDEIELNCKKVILKIDVEGMELDVLKGADMLLKLDETQVYVCLLYTSPSPRDM